MDDRITYRYVENAKTGQAIISARPQSEEQREKRKEMERKRKAGELSAEEVEKERERKRTSMSYSAVKRKSIKQRFYFFNTFNSPRLKHDGRALLRAVKAYLRISGMEYLAVIEAFERADDGYHVHALTDRQVDFNAWMYCYGGNIHAVAHHSFDEPDMDRDLYSEHIYDGSSPARCIQYMSKRIPLTKARLGKGSQICVSSNDGIDNATITVAYDRASDHPIVEINNIAFYLLCKRKALQANYDEESYIAHQLDVRRRLMWRHYVCTRKVSKADKELLRYIKQDLKECMETGTGFALKDIHYGGLTLDEVADHVGASVYAGLDDYAPATHRTGGGLGGDAPRREADVPVPDPSSVPDPVPEDNDGMASASPNAAHPQNAGLGGSSAASATADQAGNGAMDMCSGGDVDALHGSSIRMHRPPEWLTPLDGSSVWDGCRLTFRPRPRPASVAVAGKFGLKVGRGTRGTQNAKIGFPRSDAGRYARPIPLVEAVNIDAMGYLLSYIGWVEHVPDGAAGKLTLRRLKLCPNIGYRALCNARSR